MTTRLVLLISSGLLLASPVLADVCGDVARAVADAPNGFASLRGNPQRHTSRPRWVVNRPIAEMACVIGEETSRREVWLECGAEAQQLAPMQQRHRALVAALKSCPSLRLVADRRDSERTRDVDFVPAAGGRTQLSAQLRLAVDYEKRTWHLLRLKISHAP